ncbi:MAG: ATP phosphoribosyltransferase [Lysobacter sp.]|nr:ATP phosphoribosyltransferase [Lysobacter sp.]
MQRHAAASARDQLRDRLRIAIQKSGRLSEPALALLAAAGLSWQESRDKLFYYGESLPIDLLLVRDDDIPGLIADGVCDLGFVGRNVLVEQDYERQSKGEAPAFRELRGLGFGRCKLMFGIPDDWDWDPQAQLPGTRIATSYPALLSRWLSERSIDASVVTMSGSVELAPRLGQADLVCDLVSSGATLASNRLKPVEVVLDSEAVLAGPAGPIADARAGIAELLMRRLDGVLKLRDSKLLMFQAPRAILPHLMQLLPDAEPPTVMSLDGGSQPRTDGDVALQALCHGAMTWQRLEELKRAGARGLMVLPVERLLA